ncbi:hypothetical protein PM082_024215 [Marasmius tenuissimus]|nr:hypothetical protein PM082_024215 [Marasmius tenuissimus]
MSSIYTPPKVSSALQARGNKALLTQQAKSGTPIKYFEGLVGNVFADHLVTTPKFNLLCEPPLNMQKVCLCRDNPFGMDNPLHYTQPFDSKASFMVCIHVQYNHYGPSLPELNTAWLPPSDDLFVKSPGFNGLGHLHCATLDYLRSLTDHIFHKFPIDAPQKEQFIADTFILLCRMLACLKSPATQMETFSCFACAQRYALDLLARYEWVTIYRAKFKGRG